jgi:uncharacterized RDD family membrane protein YckC
VIHETDHVRAVTDRRRNDHQMLTYLSVPTLLGVLLLPAVAFALAYPSIVTHLSRGLISPYAKADVGKRLTAASIDGLVVTTLCLLSWIIGSVLYLIVSGAYLLLRDAIGGQSIGKLLLGLVVIDLETGRVSSISGSLRRNLLLLLPGANVVAVFLEARTIIADRQGQRLGDRLAQTQVIEGAGARDLAKSLQDWLMRVGIGFGHAAGGRRRVPGEIDRCRVDSLMSHTNPTSCLITDCCCSSMQNSAAPESNV